VRPACAPDGSPIRIFPEQDQLVLFASELLVPLTTLTIQSSDGRVAFFFEFFPQQRQLGQLSFALQPCFIPLFEPLPSLLLAPPGLLGLPRCPLRSQLGHSLITFFNHRPGSIGSGIIVAIQLASQIAQLDRVLAPRSASSASY
jgi:hypothetical protein